MEHLGEVRGKGERLEPGRATAAGCVCVCVCARACVFTPVMGSVGSVQSPPRPQSPHLHSGLPGSPAPPPHPEEGRGERFPGAAALLSHPSGFCCIPVSHSPNKPM